MAYYVTTPIYYVNAEPHLGHAYTTIAADILARHMRQRGEEVFFLTGTDEHGEPVAQAAERLGTTPSELADRNSVRFRDLVARLGVTNDFFIRTTDDDHARGVSEILQRIYDGGHVYSGTYEGWYCPRCADFKTDNEVEDGDRCPVHKIELEREKEDNYFFRLSAFQEPLERLYAERPDFVLPRNRFNEALSFIKGGVNDVSLSRASLSWGVPIPWDPRHVVYVWFDALLNYYTALSYAGEQNAGLSREQNTTRSPAAGGGMELSGTGERDLTERFWPPTVQLIGKDILKFHAVIWPALLMAADLPTPGRIFSHGYLLIDEQKMSKSLGNVIDPFQVIETHGTDALRHYLFRQVGFGQDGSVSTATFATRYTTELANEYGNLAARTLAMIHRYRDGVIPQAAAPAALASAFEGLAERVCGHFDRVEVSAALDEIWSTVRRLNQYVQDQAPWQLAKDPGAAASLDSILYGLVEGLRVVATLLLPFLPDASGRLLSALGQVDDSLAAAVYGSMAGGAQIEPLAPLFPKVEAEAEPAAI